MADKDVPRIALLLPRGAVCLENPLRSWIVKGPCQRALHEKCPMQGLSCS